MYRIAFIISLVIISSHTVLGLSGSGTEADPWRIQSLADFDEFAADANYWDDWTRLETDVNLAGLTYTTAVIAFDPFEYNYDFDGTAFTGVFDGNDHKIIGLTIDDGGADYYYLGLFGYIDDGEVRSLGLEGISVVGGESFNGGLVGVNSGSISNCYSTGEVRGYDEVGGLVGKNYNGSVSNCYSTADVSGKYDVGDLVGENYYGIVSNCYSTGDVSRVRRYAGGIVGHNHGSVSHCYSTGDVSGESCTGGLVGGNGDEDEKCGSIYDCYSTSNVSGSEDQIGGLVGGNYGAVSNCCFTGEVSGYERVGGLVGYNLSGSVFICYSSGDIAGTYYIGGLIGWNHTYYEGSVSNCFWDTETQSHGITDSFGYSVGTVTNVAGLTTAEMQTKSTFISAGWDFIGESTDGTNETWQMPAVGGYPILSFFHIDIPYPLAGSGTVSDPYLISDANELGMLSWYTDGCHIKMTRDIDLSGINWSVSVVSVFAGHFHGDHHIISNMQISGGGYLGLFGFFGNGGEVRNLGFEAGSVGGHSYVGGLVGYNSGTVKDCYWIGSLSGDRCVGGLVGSDGDWDNPGGTIMNCYSMGEVSGYRYVGGLVGGHNGSLSNCYSTSDVNGTEDSVGGLVGFNGRGSVSNCSSCGDVSGEFHIGGLVGHNRDILSNCYSTGYVSGDDAVGGLVGYNYEGNMSKCYSSGDVSGVYYVGGLVGHNYYGSVLDCNSTGFVSGHGSIGGLVGRNYDGSVSDCYSKGEVSGDSSVGGLVGDNDGIVSKCYSTGYVGSGYTVGGLVGINDRTISNSYSTGDVSGSGGLVGHNSGSVSNCYSTGDVNGGDSAGGLVGSNNFSSVSNSFWDTDTQSHGVTESIGDNSFGTAINVAGLPTAEMQTKSTFTSFGWDFVDVWDLTCEGMSYPRFIWQIPPADFLCPHGVDFRDYSFFAGYWGDTNCGDANDCDGTDFDLSGTVDIKDIDIFCGHWLEGAGG